MRVVMMGTGPFAVPTFRALLASDHEVLALVTRPVPPQRGRSKSAGPPPNPMRDVATAADLDVYEPESINSAEFADQLQQFQADLFVVCDYGQILSREALAAARLGGINLHASLLPKYRGAAPINWALYHGEQATGVTVIHMTPKLDGGPCLVQESVPVSTEVDAVQLEAELAELGVDAVLTSIRMLDSWKQDDAPLGILQDPQLATKAPRLKKQDGAVDWNRSASQIRDQVRAFRPWPGTYTFWTHPKRGAIRLAIGQVSITDGSSDQPPGTVVHVDKQSLVVASGDGLVGVETLQPAGKKMLPVHEFLRGYPVTTGDQLATTATS